jgi:cell division protein FtsN
MQSEYKSLRSQRGGTVLGFILGLLVGLLISLGIVIYVTKVPIPFLNKSVSRTAEQDAAEEKKNKDWDPNAPLYNKSTNKSDTSNAGPAATPSKAEDKNDTAADKPPASTVDLIGDLIRSKTDTSGNTTSSASSAPAQDPFSYYVQAGAFRSNEEAESQRAKLVIQGYDPRISDKEQGGKTVYRVRIGPLSAKEEAEKIQLKLASSKIEAAIVRVQR